MREFGVSSADQIMWTAERDPVSVVTDPGPNQGKQIEWHPWP